MADPRFYRAAGPFKLGELARIAEAEIAAGADPERRFKDVQPLSAAGPDDLSFLDNKRYRDEFRKTRAGAVLVHPDLARDAPSGTQVLLSRDPYRAYARAAAAFYPMPAPEAGVHPAAHVDPAATLARGCRIEAGAVIGANATVGAGSLVAANAVVGFGVRIGEGSVVGPTATLSHCLIGARVILHAGVRIGQDGFGFALGPQGHLKVPQLGRVVVEDDVEIGANSTIDRGAGPDTVIGQGTKIDNLVQIAHNVRIGRGCIIVSQVGISGSTRLGDFVMLGGQAGLTGHLTIGDGARVAAQSGVMRDVEPGATIGGSPALAQREWLRSQAALARMSRKQRGE